MGGMLGEPWVLQRHKLRLLEDGYSPKTKIQLTWKHQGMFVGVAGGQNHGGGNQIVPITRC